MNNLINFLIDHGYKIKENNSIDYVLVKDVFCVEVVYIDFLQSYVVNIYIHSHKGDMYFLNYESDIPGAIKMIEDFEAGKEE